MRSLLVGSVLLVASDAWAGDKGACHKARRTQTIDGWTKYVLDHPEGACVDEATGQLVMLGIGRVVNGIAGDPTKVALMMAQVGHMSDDDFASFRDLMGSLSGLGGLGGGLGGLGGGFGGLGGGLGGLGGGLDGLGESLGGLGEAYGEGGILGGEGFGVGEYGALQEQQQVYVGFSVVSTAGGWSSDEFYGILDDARFGMQECWQEKGLPLVSVSYDAEFGLTAGKVDVKGLKMTYSSDSATHADHEACVERELEELTFPAQYTGTYTYRVDFY